MKDGCMCLHLYCCGVHVSARAGLFEVRQIPAKQPAGPWVIQTMKTAAVSTPFTQQPLVLLYMPVCANDISIVYCRHLAKTLSHLIC